MNLEEKSVEKGLRKSDKRVTCVVENWIERLTMLAAMEIRKKKSLRALCIFCYLKEPNQKLINNDPVFNITIYAVKLLKFTSCKLQRTH